MTRIALLLGSLYFLFVLRSDPLTAVPSVLLRPYGEGFSGWLLMLDLSTNAFSPWRPDSIIAALFTPGVRFSGAFGIASGIVFVVGFSLYLHLVGRRRPAGLSAAVLTALLTLLFLWCAMHPDSAAIPQVMWVSWLVLAALGVVQLTGAMQGAAFLLYLFVAWRLTSAAGPAAIPMLALARLLYHQVTDTPQDGRRRSAHAPLLMIVPVLFVGIQLFERAPMRAPDYPALGHVVSDDGVAGVDRPLVGEAAPIPFISRSAVRELYRNGSLLLLVFALGGLLLRRGARPMPALGAAAALAAALVWSTVPAERWALVGPLAALARVVPALSFQPLEPLAYVCTVLLLATALMKGGKITLFAPILVITAIGTAAARGVPPISGGLLLDRSAIELGASLLRTQARYGLTEEVIISPSFAVLRGEGPLSARRAIGADTLREVPLAGVDAQITTSAGDDERTARRMADGKPNTRWSSKRAFQAGDEWIRISMPRRSVRGLVLGLGEFSADFPRALRIDQCDYDPPVRLYPEHGVSAPRWEGPVQLTPAGFPYFGWQSDVRVVLPGPIDVSCLKISQLGMSPDFDWSVAEVALLVPEEPTH